MSRLRLCVESPIGADAGVVCVQSGETVQLSEFPDPSLVRRDIVADKPRVTRIDIEW